MKVDGVTWYYGQLTNGKYVWIKSTDLSKESIRYVKTGMTLTKAANIQNNSYYNPQVQEQQENGKMLIMMKLKRYGSY